MYRAYKQNRLYNVNQNFLYQFKKIVVKLKLLYNKECQVCGSKHFRKNNGVYSSSNLMVK